LTQWQSTESRRDRIPESPYTRGGESEGRPDLAIDDSVFTAENNLSGSRDNQFHFCERRRRRRNK